MSEWMNTFDSAFWLTMGGMIIGLVGMVLRSCYQSKCEDVRLCFGMVTVHRNIIAEEDIDIQMHGTAPAESKV